MLLPMLAIAQFDFETRYFTIDETSLPEAPQFNELPDLRSLSTKEVSGSFILDNIPTFAGTLSSFKIDTSNYWEPVNMRDALNSSSNYMAPNYDVAALNAKTYGFTSYAADGSTKVKNTVYTEVRGLDLLDPCPPFGICPRCAPYRAQRGF
mgnify:CR=1 FL=1